MLEAPQVDEDHRDVNTGNQEEGDQNDDFVQHSGLLKVSGGGN